MYFIINCFSGKTNGRTIYVNIDLFVVLQLTPLFKMKEVTASKLVAKLRQEAEEFRKEKKRNTLSGVHKYEYLIGKNEFDTN